LPDEAREGLFVAVGEFVIAEHTKQQKSRSLLGGLESVACDRFSMELEDRTCLPSATAQGTNRIDAPPSSQTAGCDTPDHKLSPRLV